MPASGLLDGFDLVIQFDCGERMDSDWIAIEFENTPEDLALSVYSGKLKHSAQKVKALLDHFDFANFFLEND